MAHLKIVYGPMFSGKSTDIIGRINVYLSSGKGKIILINSASDTRKNITDVGVLTTHSKIESTFETERLISLKVEKLENIDKNIFDENVEVVIIDESQFFPDLPNFIDYLLNKDKNVICYGLVSDFCINPFGKLPEIFHKADEVEQLFAVCKRCLDEGVPRKNALATFTKRKSDKNGEQYLPGGEETYEAVCRKHHH